MPDDDATLEVEESVADEASAAIEAVTRITSRDAAVASEAPTEAAPPPPKPPRGQREPDPVAGDAAYLGRVKQRQQAQEQGARIQQLEAQNIQYQQYANALLQQRVAAETAAVAPAEPTFPTIDPDVKEWIGHEMQGVRQDVAQATEPLRQAQQRQEQQEQHQSQQAGLMAEMGRVEEEEVEYAQTEMGQGYHGRAEAFRSHYKEVLRETGRQFPAQALTEEQIEHRVNLQSAGLVREARQAGVPVPYYADMIFRQFGVTGNGNATTPAASAALSPPPPSSQNVAAAQAAIQDGMAEAPMSRGHEVDSGAMTIDRVVESGLSPKDVAELAKGGNLVKKLGQLAAQVDKELLGG